MVWFQPFAGQRSSGSLRRGFDRAVKDLADLPEVSGFYLWRARLTINNLGAQNDLHVFFISCSSGGARELSEVGWVGDEFTCRYGSPSGDTCDHDSELSSIAIR